MRTSLLVEVVSGLRETTGSFRRSPAAISTDPRVCRASSARVSTAVTPTTRTAESALSHFRQGRPASGNLVQKGTSVGALPPVTPECASDLGYSARVAMVRTRVRSGWHAYRGSARRCKGLGRLASIRSIVVWFRTSTVALTERVEPFALRKRESFAAPSTANSCDAYTPRALVDSLAAARRVPALLGHHLAGTVILMQDFGANAPSTALTASARRQTRRAASRLHRMAGIPSAGVKLRGLSEPDIVK